MGRLRSESDDFAILGETTITSDERLAASIKRGSIETGQVSKVLCQELSKHCSLTRWGFPTTKRREKEPSVMLLSWASWRLSELSMCASQNLDHRNGEL
ncbi:hypothetical protein Taro_025397 [Colocasia esculenta]|uniref:Uncharacterized protein n=1 Tax=Colocasia esculenta TaxID=4460 RepID=A0A843VA23_COLES|nr:hypothetical protein [Colocasia esculenta]